MDVEPIHEFTLLMKRYYQSKSERLDKTNDALWGIAIDLVQAIATLDGSSSLDQIKATGDAKASELRALLERQGG